METQNSFNFSKYSIEHYRLIYPDIDSIKRCVIECFHILTEKVTQKQFCETFSFARQTISARFNELVKDNILTIDGERDGMGLYRLKYDNEQENEFKATYKERFDWLLSRVDQELKNEYTQQFK